MSRPIQSRMAGDDAASLNVKELAAALGVSAHYVYQMRACGFEMDGLLRTNRKATVNRAVRWIRRKGFRLMNGKGIAD